MLRHSIARLQGAVQLPLWIAARGISSSPSLFKERCINAVQLLGRVGTDPSRIEFDRKKPLVAFSMATNRTSRIQNEDGTVSERDWASWHSINIIRPGLQEHVLNYVKKGTRVLVNGRLDYISKLHEDGTRTRNTNVIADDLVIFYSPPKVSEVELDEEDPLEEPQS